MLVYQRVSIWLVVEPYPSEKWSSVGMMTFPTEWKNKIHVPNHQPVVVFFVGHIDQEMVDLI